MKKGCILTALAILLLISFSTAEKLNIEIGESYIPGEKVKFKITVYDNNLKPIEGVINYEIQDFLVNIIHEGSVNSGQEVVFELPTNIERGYAGVIARYKNIEQKQLFNIGELEKAEIKLENERLIVSNIGNVPYTKPLQISIGNHDETAYVLLEVRQTKEIRLTAPPGEYNIKVTDGTEENTLEVDGVSLTGNVIGLEKFKEKSFWEEYPLVILFIFSVITIALIVIGLRFQDRFK